MKENQKVTDRAEVPPVIEAPASQAEAADLFRRFNDMKKSGKNVRVSIQDSPFRPSGHDTYASISSGRMNGIREISRKDMLAVCGGGVTLAELRAAVEAEGMFFPCDPELASTVLTIGALVMDGGVSRHERQYGRLRESILSIEMVTPAGELIHTGSRSIKDVAGYELAGLFTGGGGQYGLISSVTLRLLPATIAANRLTPSGSCQQEDKGSPEGMGRDLVQRIVAEKGILKYLSIDLRGPVPLPDPPAFGWSSPAPHRNIIIWPASSGPDQESDCLNEKKIFNFVKENFSPGARFRAGYISGVDDGIKVWRVRPNDRMEGLAGLSAELDVGPAVSEISGRIRNLFDPEMIIDDGFADD